MRKLALLVAAALVVSAPILMTPSTETYAAAKAKKGGDADPNAGLFNALSDQVTASASAADKSSSKSKTNAKGKKSKSKNAKGGKKAKAK